MIIGYFRIIAEEVICEATVGFEHVGLDSSWRFHGHFWTVLQYWDWELGTGHARQPQSEVTMNLMLMLDTRH